MDAVVYALPYFASNKALNFGVSYVMALREFPWWIPGFGGESGAFGATLTPKSGPLSRQSLENYVIEGKGQTTRFIIGL